MSGGAANRHAVKLDSRNAHTDGNALPFLAADADAFVELEIVAYHADVLQRFRSVADERRAAHGAREAAIFDQVACGCSEDEVAGGDIHLSAAEISAVEPARDRTDNVGGIAVAGQHERVGHARHGDVLVIFTAAVAGGGVAEQPAGQLVGQIPAQESVFDEHILLTGNTFVIPIERAPPISDGAYVNHGAYLNGTLMPHT